MTKAELEYQVQELSCCLRCKHSSMLNRCLFCDILNEHVAMSGVCNAFNAPYEESPPEDFGPCYMPKWD
jgi:hypothetical protein